MDLYLQHSSGCSDANSAKFSLCNPSALCALHSILPKNLEQQLMSEYSADMM